MIYFVLEGASASGMSHYPNLNDLPLEDEHALLFEVRRSFRANIAHLILFVLTAAIVYILEYNFPGASLLPFHPILKFVTVRWLGVIPAVILLDFIRRRHDSLYRFEARRLTHMEGRLSLNLSVPSVKYVDVRSITVNQSAFGRIFHFGDVQLSTAAQDGSELVVSGVVAPRELANLIDALRERSEILMDAETGEVVLRQSKAGAAQETVAGEKSSGSDTPPEAAAV